MKRLLGTLLAALLIALPSALFAASPTTVLVEGALHSGGGGPAADGDYTVTFAIYAAQTGGSAAWSEGPVTVKTANGRFSWALGSKTPLDASALGGLSKHWLGLKIGADPELARQPMHATTFALIAADVQCVGCLKGSTVDFNYAGSDTKGGPASKAKDLDCTGCVGVDEMKFDKSIDLGGNALTAAKVTSAGDIVAAGTMAAKTFLGDGSKLTGIAAPSGKCAGDKVMTGIDASGGPICIDQAGGGSAALSNEFTDALHGKKNIAIPDNDSNGLLDIIDMPAVGLAKKLEIVVEISKEPFVDANPKDGKPDYDPTDLTVLLFPPTTKDLPAPRSNIINNFLSKPTVDASLFPHYVLHQGTGAGTLSLVATFPTTTKPVSGDLTTWVGKDPKGKWRLLILDNKDRTGTAVDGKLVDWAIKVQTVNDKQLLIKGSQFVDGTLWGAYQGHGQPSLGAPVKVGGGVQLGGDKTVCNPDNEGVVRYSKAAKAIEFCNGTAWSVSSAFSNKDGAIFRWAKWNNYWAWQTGWYSDNRADLYGGVAPSNWSSGYLASQMSSETRHLAALFHRRGPGIASKAENALVTSEEFSDSYGSSNGGRFAAALFRVKNTTASAISWRLHFYCTAYGGWSERCSVALNGVNAWNSSGSDYNGSFDTSVNMSIPANRTSTVIIVSASSPRQSSMRSLNLAFFNASLKLPTGLEFVDDLDTKPNDWTN